MQFRSPEAIRVLAGAGFDWSFIDSEHGPFTQETLHDLCRAARIAGISPVVRVADLQYDLIARALDNYAEGIVFPRVESPELLEKAVSWTKFPPEGVRGCGIGPLFFDWEQVPMPKMMQHCNDNTLVVLQIETLKAVDAADELLSVKGIDAVMVGPLDLSISLGVPGEFNHPKVVGQIERVIEACRRHGVAPGIHMRPLELAQFWKSRGMQFLSCSSDFLMLYDRGKEIISHLR